MSLIFLSVVLLHISLLVPSTCLRPCAESDITTVTSECSTDTNLKYRFSVPKKPGECTLTTEQQKYYGFECDKMCEPGEFFYLSGDRQCHECPPGHYSLGSGAKIDYWPANSEGDEVKLPIGFAIEQSSVSHSYESCSKSTWTPRNDFLVSNSDHCFISLMYVAELKIPGYVEFEYRRPDPHIHFHFRVVDENCHEPAGSSVYPIVTKHDEWGKIKVALGPGSNKLYWKTYLVTYGDITNNPADNESSSDLDDRGTQIRPVLLKSVYINGVAYSTECTKCPAGYYQDKKAADTCKPCGMNKYAASEGSVTCEQCDVTSQYSLYAATKCEEMVKCTEEDYYSYHAPCKDGMTELVYAWIKPRVCRGIQF